MYAMTGFKAANQEPILTILVRLACAADAARRYACTAAAKGTEIARAARAKPEEDFNRVESSL